MGESKAPITLLRHLVITGLVPPTPAAGPEEIAAAAAEQGLAGVLHAALESGGRPWPPAVHAKLAGVRRATLVRGVRQLELAGRVQLMLEALGIPTLPLKGAALAEDLYEGEGDRPMADVDLLALLEWRQGIDLLQREGFTVLARADHAWALADPHTGFIVELHHGVTSCPDLFPVDGPGLRDRSRRGSGQVSRLPSPEDLLVHLSLHAAFQHGLVLSLLQWLDFRRLLERHSLDTARLRHCAETARAVAPLAAALLVAEAVAGAPVPEALREWTEPRLPSALGAWIRARLTTPLVFVSPRPPALARVRWGLVPGRRLALLASTLAPRTPGEKIRPGTLPVVALRRGVSILGRTVSNWRRSGQLSETEPEMSREEGVLAACLKTFPHARLTVTGRCMEPALLAGEQVVVAGASHRVPRLGDVVLFRHPAGLRLHRLVLSRGRAWRTKADRAAALDPAISPRHVLGTVVSVEGRPQARPRRPARALLSFGRAMLTRLRARP